MGVVVVVLINTRQAGAMSGRVPLTVENDLHDLAKESLTFFPDAKCCPPSTGTSASGAESAGVVALGLGLDGELVVGGECREGGTGRRGW